MHGSSQEPDDFDKCHNGFGFINAGLIVATEQLISTPEKFQLKDDVVRDGGYRADGDLHKTT